MMLKDELWVKIVACSDTKTKNALRKTCSRLKKICTKNNLALYKQSPLILNSKQSEYALSYAAYKNSLSATKNLIAQGAWSSFSYGGISTLPLDIATKKKHTRIVLFLKSCNAYCRNVYPQCWPLTAYLGDVKKLRKYVKSNKYNPLYKNHTNKFSVGYSSLLSIACIGQHTDVVTLLLSNPKTIEKINAGDSCGRVINAAVFLTNAVILEKLLSIPSFKFSKKAAFQAFSYSCQTGALECARVLYTFFTSYLRKKINCFSQTYLDNGSKAYLGQYTPLIIASFNGHYEIVDWLLSYSDDCNIQSIDTEYTPLYVAAWQGHTAVVKRLLFNKNINPKISVRNGVERETVLHCACRNGYADIVQLLVDHTPVLLHMKSNDTHELPIDIAIRYQDVNLITVLWSKSSMQFMVKVILLRAKNGNDKK